MGWFKWVRRDEVVVSRKALEDAVSNGVLTKAGQQILAEEAKIDIKVPVGRPRKRQAKKAASKKSSK